MKVREKKKKEETETYKDKYYHTKLETTLIFLNEEWTNNVYFIYTMEYYLGTKNEAIMKFACTSVAL